jgi:hypothetical protein
MNGDFDAKEIIGAIFGIILIIGIVIPMISLIFNVMNQSDSKQQEINGLKSQIGLLQQESANKDIKINELTTTLSSINNTMSEKDGIISNLSGTISQKDIIIQNLTYELSFYKEKEYLTQINNNFYNISNYFERIENKFFPIEISLSLISITLLTIIIKIFSLHIFIRKVWIKITKKEQTTTKMEVHNHQYVRQ